MMPAVPDPPEIHDTLWADFGGDIGFDIGANCGQTLPEMTRRFRKVLACEPVVECRPFLAQFPTVTVLEIAVSDHVGAVDLIALPDKIDTGQLVTGGTSGMEWNPDAPGAVRRTVNCTTIDRLATLVAPPHFIKVDVEGHEDRVLNGARDLLRDAPPQWLIEFHTPGLYQYCVSLLKTFGYTVKTVRHPHYTPDSPMWKQHGWIKAFPPSVWAPSVWAERRR